MERILIGVAWPYANGDLHLGHVAGSLLPPDIFARFHRMQGHDVLMVSGSDEHGTPITVTAEEEGVDPQEVVDRYHEQHVQTLDELGISFDMFTRTSTGHHRERVHEIFRGLNEQGYIETREMTAPYDPKAKRFLPDRFVEGTCPHCDSPDARGDQCDACGKMLDADELVDPRSNINPDVDIEFRETTHWFFKLGAFQDRLEDYVSDKDHWRSNVRKFTENWLEEGLEDRAVTRDLTWGIPVPDDDPMWDDKRIYVWFEAVCGYLTASMYWAKQEAGDPDAWRRFWEDGYDDVDTRSYYFLAKDNIPFHTIIWPAILMGYSDAREAAGEPRLHVPYDVPGNEYLNLSGEQFSKSRGVGIWAREVLAEFETDAIRYYLAVNMPETRDADWTWEDFLSKVNNELVAAYGNFVHRTLSLVHEHFGRIPEPGDPQDAEEELVGELEAAHASVTDTLEQARFKEPLREIMQLARAGNRYIDAQQPWSLADEDPERAATVLHHCARLCRGLAILTAPYLPHSAQRLWEALGQEGSVHEADWDEAPAELEPGAPIGEPEPLFEKLDEDEVLGLVATEEEPGEDEEEDEMSQISFEDFQDVDMRIGRVNSVEDHPDADKLYVIEVDLGTETRQLVAGLKNLVEPSTLEGLEVVVVANLEPATIRGVESQGMLLAAEADEDTVSPLTIVDDLDPGAKVR